MSTSSGVEGLNWVDTPVGYISIAVFAIALFLVVAEEFIHLRKSKPVIIAGSIIWIAIIYTASGTPQALEIEGVLRHLLEEYAEIFFFLVVAMSYISALEERLVFEYLRSKLVSSGLSLRKLFWLTGGIAFLLSPIADNLTTALLMSAVVLSVGGSNLRFSTVACINVVVAANAGGAFSPFGDITTLMVWQKGLVDFWTFFDLLIPSFVNWFVPALIMSLAIGAHDQAAKADEEVIVMKRGAKRAIFLFMATIATAVSAHALGHVPPVFGMLVGFGYILGLGYYLKKTHSEVDDPFDVFHNVKRVEWDTLLFFLGVIFCVGSLGYLGHLALVSKTAYGEWGIVPYLGPISIEISTTIANVGVGILSAIVDNIPVMFAVLNMDLEMSQGHWLLVTLTAGVGGSLLSIGSAAGVAVMGKAKGVYTFWSHLRWSWAIFAGYVVSILVHLVLNADMF